MATQPGPSEHLILSGYVAAGDCADRAIIAVEARHDSLLPSLRLDLFELSNARFCIGPGLDGLVITAAGAAVQEMAIFSEPGRSRSAPLPLDLPEHAEPLDDVFIGFDAAWSNWFHWLCFAVARSRIAADLLPSSCRIILPDFVSADLPALRIQACRQSLAAARLSSRVTLLEPGIYRARRLRFLWTDAPRPALLGCMQLFQHVFADMRRDMRRRPEYPSRLLIARDRDANPRLDPAETTLLHRVAQTHGFVPTYFGEMDFNQQAAYMFNADAVIGVHGAGLTNVLLARESLRILEINRIIGQEKMPRPWFRLLCQTRRQRYDVVEAGAGGLTPDALDRAVERLCDGPPASARAGSRPPTLLASVCNTTPNALSAALWLGRGDTQAAIELQGSVWRPGDVGLTGLAWHAGRLYCAVQTSAEPRVLILDRSLNHEGTITCADFVDLHSLAADGDGLLIVSTGNNRVLRYGFSDQRIDTICMLRADVHLNSVCRDDQDLLVCCQNLQPLDATAQIGGIYSVAERRVLLDGLGFPHSLMRAGNEFLVLDSGHGRIIRFGRDGIKQEARLSGFLRGATLHDSTLFVVSGPLRLISRATGEIWHDQTLRQAMNEHVMLHELDATTLEVRATRQLIAAGFEVYDVLAMPADAGPDPAPERVLPASQTAFARLFYNAFMKLQAERRRQ